MNFGGRYALFDTITGFARFDLSGKQTTSDGVRLKAGVGKNIELTIIRSYQPSGRSERAEIVTQDTLELSDEGNSMRYKRTARTTSPRNEYDTHSVPSSINDHISLVLSRVAE